MLDRKLGWVAIVAFGGVVAACGADDAGGGNLQNGSAGTGTGGTSVMDATAGTGGGPAMGSAGSGLGTAVGPGTGGMSATAPGGTGGGGGAGGAGGMTGGSGGTMSATPGTSPSPTDPPDISTCAQPPASSTPAAMTAFEVVNTLRLATGAGCAVMVEALNASSTNHCVYYAANTADKMCTADPHGEVESCMSFTGTGPGQRMKAAGYTGNGGSEVMAFNNNPKAAIDQWINSVWHRIPLLDPWTAEIGYGAAAGCDVMDLGRGTPAPDSTVTVYPYDNQVDVPVDFDGSREGPMPPAPSSGWPSGSPINVYAKMLTVTEHVLTKDGDATPIEHVWLTAAESNFLRSGVMMYSNAPLAAMTKYRVEDRRHARRRADQPRVDIHHRHGADRLRLAVVRAATCS